MDHVGNVTRNDHTIDIPRNDLTSPSTSHPHNHNDLDELNRNRGPSNDVPPVPEISGTTSFPDFRSASFTRRDQGNRQQNPLNSGLWISIELIVNVSQIIAAATVLSVSRNEHPRAPLFEWVVGYIIGCVVTIPHLYWRYLHRNCQNIEQEPAAQGSSQRNISESDSFAAISAAHASEAVNDNSTGVSRNNFPIASPRLCIVFLAFGFIGYALPFILCTMICCCLPCIISMVGFHEDLDLNKGATAEVINALVAYKYKSMRIRDGDVGEDNGGVLAAGTEKERTVSAEDAVCCICLSRFSNNENLRELPCAHVFHMECIDKWLKINALCPLCKSELGGSTASPDTSSEGHQHVDRVGDDVESQR